MPAAASPPNAEMRQKHEAALSLHAHDAQRYGLMSIFC